MMTPFCRIVFVCLLLGLPICALAQNSAPTDPQNKTGVVMPEIVITTDREPTPVEKVTGAVTVITREEMEQRQLRTVSDALRSVPGVSVQQSGGVGSQTSVFIRGTDSNHIVVMIDGMNVSDPSTPNGAIDFAHLLTENFERIEVVRGPMSTLYGSGAIGGVVNMVTKKGEGKMNGGGFAEMGTRLETSMGGYVRGSVERFNYNVSATGLYTPGDTVVPGRFTTPGGFTDQDPYRNVTFAGRLGFDISENAQLTWFGRYIDTSLKYDQVAMEDPNAIEFTQQFFNRLQFDGTYFDGMWKPTVGIGYSTVYRHDQDFPSIENPFPFTKDSYFNGRRLQADWKNVIDFNEMLNFVGGIDYDNQWAYSNSDGAQQWGQASQTGIYGQLRATLLDALTLSAGGRVDFHSLYGSNGTWRVGAAYLLRETDTKFKASYGTSFKAPSLLQLYSGGAFCAGNPNLQPETSRGWEAGVEQGMWNGKVKGGITYFKNNLSNLIDCVAPFAQYTNTAPQASTEGTESFIQIAFTSWLDLYASYTHLFAFNLTTGAWLLRRPEDTYSVRLTARPVEGVRLGAELTQVEGRHDLDPVTGAPIQPWPYTLLRATASWDVRKDLELFGRIENALNRVYEEPAGFNAPILQVFFGAKARF
jgi:vitamin B12 transporter